MTGERPPMSPSRPSLVLSCAAGGYSPVTTAHPTSTSEQGRSAPCAQSAEPIGRATRSQINRLYRSITGRDRSTEEFAWEWLDTWAGQGSMNLVFDLDREEGDQLIAQYSLIPTPLSVWGRPVAGGQDRELHEPPRSAGAPACTSLTSGSASRRRRRGTASSSPPPARWPAAPSAGSARKLGYVAFDDWANYTLWLQTSALRADLDSILGQGAGPARSWRPWRAACWRRSCRRTAGCGGHARAATGWRCTARPMRRWRRSPASGSGIATQLRRHRRPQRRLPAVAGERRSPRRARVPDHARRRRAPRLRHHLRPG